MSFFNFFQRKKQTPANTNGTNSAVAKSVLNFISLGLTNGAELLSETYKPSSKVTEFVNVSLKILEALKRGYEQKFATNFVIISMKVNNTSKEIELTQLGRDVMLSLDNSTTIISSITLIELYANLRNDMIKHPEIYGKERQLTAISFPDPAW